MAILMLTGFVVTRSPNAHVCTIRQDQSSFVLCASANAPPSSEVVSP